MNQSIIKIGIGGILLLSFFQTFAFSSELHLDKTKANVDDTLELQLIIHSSEGGQISVENVKGLENFTLQGKSQSSSFSSVNGHVTSALNVTFSLIPKTKGKFELGPVTLSDGKQKIETNSVSVEVSGDKMFLNGNQLQTPVNGNTLQKSSLVQEIPQSKIPEKESEIPKIIILVGVLILLTLSVYLTLKKDISQKEEKEKKSDRNEIKIFELHTEIIYPELTHSDFAEKMDEILRQKLEQKYHIETKTKNYSEIFLLIPENEKKYQIQEIMNLLSQGKYSNLITNNARILEIMKEL